MELADTFEQFDHKFLLCDTYRIIAAVVSGYSKMEVYFVYA